MKDQGRYQILLFMLLLFFFSCSNRKQTDHTEHQQQAEQVIYTCPMHPEIIRDAPGSCPICGMDLVRKETGNKAVQDIELEDLLKPTSGFVVSSIPVTTMEEREEDIELSVVGRVDYDTRQSGVISSRIKGRIERLYVRYRYQPIQKGQKIMDIYAPELVTAQQNLIFLLRNDAGNTSLIDAAKNRLLLMGMTSNQVAQVIRSKTPQYSVPVFSNYSGFVTELNKAANSSAGNMQNTVTNQELSIKEGMYVQSGQSLFSVYNPARAWILLDLFPEQQILVKTGNVVRIVPETAPHQSFRAKIDYIEPVFRSGTKTLNARVYFNNASLRLPIGSRVSATIFANPKRANWIPNEAVVSLGRDKIVFLKEQGGFRAHPIGTGLQLRGHTEVTSGLSENDSIALNAQFLIDNEAFIKVNNE